MHDDDKAADFLGCLSLEFKHEITTANRMHEAPKYPFMPTISPKNKKPRIADEIGSRQNIRLACSGVVYFCATVCITKQKEVQIKAMTIKFAKHKPEEGMLKGSKMIATTNTYKNVKNNCQIPTSKLSTFFE